MLAAANGRLLPPAGTEKTMHEERKSILELLAHGKITAAEAAMLLDALEGPEPVAAVVEEPAFAMPHLPHLPHRPHAPQPPRMPPTPRIHFGWQQRRQPIDPRLSEALARLGLADLSEEDWHQLQIHHINTAFVERYRGAGVKALTIEELVQLKIHNVPPELVQVVREVAGADVAIDEIVPLAIHRVNPELVRELVAWKGADLDWHSVAELGIHRTPLELVRQLRKLGMDEVSLADLAEMGIHRVRPAFVEEVMGLNLPGIEPHHLVEMRIYGLRSGFVREMAALNLPDLTPERLIEMAIHGVTADFARQMRRQYGDKLTAAQLVEMQITGHFDLGAWAEDWQKEAAFELEGAPVSYLQALKAMGLPGLDERMMMALYYQGVTVADVAGWQNTAVSDLNASNLLALHGLGLTPERVEKLAAAHGGKPTVVEIIALDAKV
ncbi:MAG: hypothetical protein KDE56_06540 [Anaerolineales bacterium]|nr:hypothetical protein [Anaerolineales bacterium]